MEPGPERKARLRQAMEAGALLLPRQGPIGVFIHHNTLDAFEHLPFEEAVVQAAECFGAEPYMSEAAYRAALAEGRIREIDIAAVIEDEPDATIFPGLGRRALRHAMLLPGVREFDAATIVWRTEQGDLARELRAPAARALWAACLARAEAHPGAAATPAAGDAIHSWLIRLCSAFLDQGTAAWPMPGREQGFYRCVRRLLSRRGGLYPRGLGGLAAEFRRQLRLDFTASDAVLDALDQRGTAAAAWPEAIQAELLALPGWAGLMWRLEVHPELAPKRPMVCSLMDYLAVRLTLERVAGRRQSNPKATAPNVGQRRLSRAARIYDAVRAVKLSTDDIERLTASEWAALAGEIKACNGRERRRLLHLAYERWHENEILGGLASHRRFRGLHQSRRPARAQVFFCIDEREESIRRALEETDPAMETYAAAGFFGIAVDYQGIDDPHLAPLCPVALKPQHAVVEQPLADHGETLRRRRRRQRWLGGGLRHALVSSKGLARGWMATAILGGLAAAPLAGDVLAPRGAARLRAKLARRLLPKPRTELTLLRAGPAAAGQPLGFTIEEMAARIAGVLRPAGLTHGFAPLVVLLGHGSSSLNNPHESAHDCGACGGRRGGPNARIFAAMANRSDVRQRLRHLGIAIPEGTWFIGGDHDSCSDRLELFDLARIPPARQPDLRWLRGCLEHACAHNALERTRRFESCPPRVSAARALRHAQRRSQHLAEPRPEYGHCSNAVAIIGRRALTRGLFLDRRAFLVSYDATQDREGRDLAALLPGVVAVCAGINLEYYFSFVDNDRYGSGTKLPHNVTGLVGVMDGHASDLRTGLPWQMVEIHEPVRALFAIEAATASVEAAIASSVPLTQWVANRWIRLAAVDPDHGGVRVWRNGRFVPFSAPLQRLPTVLSSRDWYAGKLHHLPMAWVESA